jgi:hypothetical protein
MSRLLAAETLEVAESNSRLGFEYADRFHRFLTLDGRRAYALGNLCDTCEFFFERLPGANDKASPGASVAERLRLGLDALDPDLLADAGAAFPEGRYRALLLEVVPHAVRPGATGDYFAEEQVALWGLDPFWDLPHDPRVEYYRTGAAALTERTVLYEFVVPLVSRRWLDADALTAYERRLANGDRPTALALSVLDVKGPSMFEEPADVAAHACLAHYLLDGHHKVRAAGAASRPVTLLSFLSLSESVARAEEIELALDRLRDQGAS